MGFSVSAAFSILLVSSILSFGYVYGSFDNAVDRMTKGYDEYIKQSSRASEAKIEIVNISVNCQNPACTPPGNPPYDLGIIIYNAGTETFNSSRYSFLVDGTLLTADSLSDAYHLPANNLTVTINDLSGPNTHTFKAVSEYGTTVYGTYEVG